MKLTSRPPLLAAAVLVSLALWSLTTAGQDKLTSAERNQIPVRLTIDNPVLWGEVQKAISHLRDTGKLPIIYFTGVEPIPTKSMLNPGSTLVVPTRRTVSWNGSYTTSTPFSITAHVEAARWKTPQPSPTITFDTFVNTITKLYTVRGCSLYLYIHPKIKWKQVQPVLEDLKKRGFRRVYLQLSTSWKRAFEMPFHSHNRAELDVHLRWLHKKTDKPCRYRSYGRLVLEMTDTTGKKRRFEKDGKADFKALAKRAFVLKFAFSNELKLGKIPLVLRRTKGQVTPMAKQASTQSMEKPIGKKPKGTSKSNLSTKNLSSAKVHRVMGVGGGAAGAYGHRFGVKINYKKKLVKEAVTTGLQWLARHQERSGKWSSHQFHQACRRSPQCQGLWSLTLKKATTGQQRGCGPQGADVMITSLVLLAYLSKGNTHKFGKYRKEFRQALKWLRKCQSKSAKSPHEGAIGYLDEKGIPTQNKNWLYGHILATWLICELHAMTGDHNLTRAAKQAIQFLEKHQNSDGGWGRMYLDEKGQWQKGSSRSDLTTLVSMVYPTAATVSNGLKVSHSRSKWKKALQWLDQQQQTSGRLAVGKNQKTMTGPPALTSLYLMAKILGDKKSRLATKKKGENLLKSSPPQWQAKDYSSVNHTYWTVASLVAYQIGGKFWRDWNKTLVDSLLPLQRREKGRCVDGSWDPSRDFGHVGGRVYATALAIMALQAVSRYPRKR